MSSLLSETRTKISSFRQIILVPYCLCWRPTKCGTNYQDADFPFMLPVHQVGHVSSLLSETRTKISSFRLIILVPYCLCWRPTKCGTNYQDADFPFMLPAHQVGHVSSLLSETRTKISSFRLIILVPYCLCWRPTKCGTNYQDADFPFMLPAHQVGHVSSLLSETRTKISSFRLIILVPYCLCWRPTKCGTNYQDADFPFMLPAHQVGHVSSLLSETRTKISSFRQIILVP